MIRPAIPPSPDPADEPLWRSLWRYRVRLAADPDLAAAITAEAFATVRRLGLAPAEIRSALFTVAVTLLCDRTGLNPQAARATTGFCRF